jgi:hypothetical protein
VTVDRPPLWPGEALTDKITELETAAQDSGLGWHEHLAWRLH